MNAMKYTEAQHEHAFEERARRRDEFVTRRAAELAADPIKVCWVLADILGDGDDVPRRDPRRVQRARDIARHFIDGDALSFYDELHNRMEAKFAEMADDEFAEAEDV